MNAVSKKADKRWGSPAEFKERHEHTKGRAETKLKKQIQLAEEEVEFCEFCGRAVDYCICD